MKTQLMFGAAIFAVVALTGCHHHHVTIKLKNDMVKAHPDPLRLNGSKGTDTVTWKFPANSPWLVQFLDDTPCGSVHIFQSGGTETCAVDLSALPVQTYKYYALSGLKISSDPQIVHMPTQGLGTSGTTGTITRQPSKAPTLYCLNLTSGSPTDCKTGTAVNTVMVSKGDDIYWQPNIGWVITIAAGVCGNGGTETMITSAQAYCSVSTTAASTMYMYTVKLNNHVYGPFYVQVM